MSHTARLNRNHRHQTWGLNWPIALAMSLSLWALASYTQAASAELDANPQSPLQNQNQDLNSADSAAQYANLERQIELGEFAPAINELKQKIETIESAQHRYHADLIKPLTLLGDAKHGAEDYPGALDAYGRAIHLTRISSGLHSADQVAGVYREAKVYRSAGDLQQANNREEYAWRVLQKTHGRYSAKLLPGIHHLADWYGQTYNILAARALYMRAIRIVEANYDELHPEMVTSLRGLAQTYRLERFPPRYINNASTDLSTVTPSSSISEDNAAILLNRFPQGEKALRRVVRIQQAKLALLEPKIVSSLEFHDENSDKISDKDKTTPSATDPNNPNTTGTVTDPVALARARQKLIAALVELGDWFLLFERSRVAMQYYAQADEINAKLSPGYAKVDFSLPQLLHFPAPGDPRPPKPQYRGERKQGFVELNYTITVRGSIANLETVNSSPKGLMDYRVRKSMLAARYRPTFLNGAPVATQNHTYRYQFNYYPSKSDPAAAEQPQPATQPSTEPTAQETPAIDAEATTATAVALK